MKITSTIRNFFSASTTLPGTEGSGRLEFIDGLRGVTMLMVVYWHVLVMSLDITTYTAMTLQLFRMPLFFFVSGFFAYSYNYDKNKLRLRLNNRWQRQLLPTLIIFALYILFEVIFYGYWTNGKEFTGDFFNSLTRNGLSEFKSGYWFTFVLVEVVCVFAPLNIFCHERIFRAPVRD